MNDYDRFMATLESIMFLVNDDIYEKENIRKWQEDLNQTIAMYNDMCTIQSGKEIGKTKFGENDYEGKCQYCLEYECDCDTSKIENGKFYKNSFWPVKNG